MSNTSPNLPPATIDAGLCDWQILQQNPRGTAGVTLGGRWWTVQRRSRPEVRVRIVREGGFSAIDRRHDWVRARTDIDPREAGDRAGRYGTWTLTLDAVPRGGPYRLETIVGSEEDGLEWRRVGESVNFFGVGDLWLIAGQSNAAGTALSPIDDPARIGVHQLGPEGGWRLASHGRHHHPWLAFAKTLHRELHHPIGLIPTAVGGSPVSRWDPGQKGDLFLAMADRLRQAGGVRGVLWYQGEGDAQPDALPHYKQRFSRFVAGVRQLASDPRLPVITVQLNRRTQDGEDAGWQSMREIQRQLHHEIDHVYIISAFDSVLSDFIHNGSLGNLLIAQRAADTALGGVYGRDIPFRHPECVRALAIAPDQIDLTFDHVVDRLEYYGGPPARFPFAVRDDRGEVPTASHSIPDRQTFRILLARPLEGPATVTGAPGACPPHVIPCDLHGYRGMLGFTLDVQTTSPG